MAGFESQEEDAPKCILFFKTMSWLGQIRSHRRDESWSPSLWQTFFSTSMDSQIPVMVENPFTTCGWRKFQLDPPGDHLNTCTVHSGVKMIHDWMVDQFSDLFRITHNVKTHQVVKSRGQHCGDIELSGYLVNETGPVPLVLDLRIAHDRVGISTDPNLNGHFIVLTTTTDHRVRYHLWPRFLTTCSVFTWSVVLWINKARDWVCSYVLLWINKVRDEEEKE
jgi:hypothetical protein